MVSMTFAILNTWICLAGVLGIVLPSGGPVSFLYGFLLAVACNLCITSSLGELASVWPTAGGQYHWAYALATDRWKAATSFVVGWTNIAGWLTLVTTEAFFAAQFLSAAIVVGSGGSYEITPWRTYLIFCGVSTFTILLNIYGYHILGRWNEGALLWSVLGCFVLSVVILATSEKNDASFVFTDFANTTGWNGGVAWILGLCQVSLSLIGFDAVVHMTEEMPRPTRDAPVAMNAAVMIGGTTGTVFILVMMFAITDIDTVLTTATGMPLTEIFYQATKNRAAAVVLTIVPVVCFVNGTNGCLTSGSRLLWAMARDGGTPFSKYLSHIHPRLNVPVRAILVASVFNFIFGLLYLGPVVAFNAYIASCTIFLNCSYAAPIVVLLIRGRRIVMARTPDYALGHYRGLVINVIAVTFVGFTSFFFLFPNTIPVNDNTMNYVSAVVGIFLLFVCGLWFFKRGTYEGPRFDLILGQSSTDDLELKSEKQSSTVDKDEGVTFQHRETGSV